MRDAGLPGRVREIRKRRLQKTQAELAAALGYSRAETISDWERGATEPPPEKLQELAELAGMTYDEAFGGLRSGVRERMSAYDPGHELAEFGEAEQWLRSLLAPDSLRRMARTLEGRSVIKGLRGIVADLEWPPEKKKAADALLSEALLDEGPPES